MPEEFSDEQIKHPSPPEKAPISVAIGSVLASMIATPKYRDAIFVIPIDVPELDLAEELRKASNSASGEGKKQLLEIKFSRDDLDKIRQALVFAREQHVITVKNKPRLMDPLLAFAIHLYSTNPP